MSVSTLIRTVARVTPQEYLALEKEATTKHEYFEGEVIEVAGAKFNHNLIVSNTQTFLVIALRDREGLALGSDQRVRIDEDGPFYYPDISVILEGPVIDEDNCLRNPYVIVEVLSESTAAFDRDEKFRAYRRLPSLRHYVLVAQDEVRVEHFERLTGEIWALVGEHEALTETLIFADSEIAVPLTEIYRRVAFPEG